MFGRFDLAVPNHQFVGYASRTLVLTKLEQDEQDSASLCNQLKQILAKALLQ